MGSLTDLAHGYRAEQRIELLDGRLTVDLPAEAFRRPFRRQAKPESVFTRVVLPGPPGQRIEIYADELFVTCEDELADVVRDENAGRRARGWYPIFTRMDVVPTAGLDEAAVSFTPSAYGGRWDAEIHVRHPDTSIQRLRMSASRSAVHHVGDDLTRLALEIVATLRPGPRVLDGRGRRHGLVGARTPGLTVDTPNRWYAHLEQCPNFDRHVLHRLGVYGRRPPAVIQIVVDDGMLPGDYFSANGAELGHRPPPLLGEHTCWYATEGRLDHQHRTVRAACVPYRGREPARIWVTADDDPELNPELDRIIASLSPAPDPALRVPDRLGEAPE